MNESEARSLLWARVLEADAHDRSLLATSADSDLSQIAADQARAEAARRGVAATDEMFLLQRARLLGAEYAASNHGTSPFFLKVRPWIGQLVILFALLLGVLSERLGSDQRLSILAFPLMSVLGWNLLVYGWLGLSWLLGRQKRAPISAPRFGWLGTSLAGVGRRPSARRLRLLKQFSQQWLEVAGSLLSARLARILHLSAAALAIGAVSSLYVRGMLLEYRAGWESTFLNAEQVHALLSVFLGPLAHWLGQPFPDVAHIAALSWDRGNGENAASWIHLYALALAIVVIAPRLLLAAWAGLREHRLSRNFPLSLDDGNFQRALRPWRNEALAVCVQPYAYTLSDLAAQNLQRDLLEQFGDQTKVQLLPVLALGDEDHHLAIADREKKSEERRYLLFNLASTPETEHHGMLLRRLRTAPSEPWKVWVDESTYRQRLGALAEAKQRLQERRNAWRALADAEGYAIEFIDLGSTRAEDVST